MNTKFCQSCGMPMDTEEAVWGTNADGSQNEEYCSYCYQDGKFNADMSMEEMIEICVPPMTESTGMEPDKAREMMRSFMPTLKRWKDR